MKSSNTSYWRLAGIAQLLLLVLAVGGLPGPALAADCVYVAVAETGELGTVTSGNLLATQEADGAALKIAEAKDSGGNYGLEWIWEISGIEAADSFRLQVTAQATNSKQGMDHYAFDARIPGGDWTPLGIADQTTMAAYAWPLPADLDPTGGTLFIRATDTNRSADPRRANQLWLDQLVLIGQAGNGGNPDDPGDDPPPGPTGPDTDRIIAGYYPSWAIYSAREYWVRYIPFDRVTHVYYAFANVDPNTHEVIIGDEFAELTNRKDPETSNGLPAGNLNQLVHFRDVGFNGPPQSHLKIIISVGGWSWSANFSAAAATPASRYAFASSLASFVNAYNLNGADIDWEFPTGNPANCGLDGNGCQPEDPVNHALLLMACGILLGDDKELSIAMPANAVSASSILPPLVTMLDDSLLVYEGGGESVTVGDIGKTAVEMLDFIHIMNYDQVGASWQEITRHHAPLYAYDGPGGDPADDADQPGGLANLNAHYAVQAYLYARGNYSGFDPDAANGTPVIPREKLTLGIPMYGRGFGSVDSGGYEGYDGLFRYTDSSTRRRVPKGTWDGGKWGNSGVFAYWDILLRHGGEVWTVGSASDSLGDGGRFYGNYLLEGDLFIGFDDLVSVREKVQYVVEQDLGGVMFWDFPGDLSAAQEAAGIPGAAAALPDQSLVNRIATELEAAGQTP